MQLVSLKLATSPTPVRHRGEVDAELVGFIRHLDCRYYDCCLNTAIEGNWPGFSCRECVTYEPRTIDELRAEAEAIRVAMAARRRGK